jgi:hypothetical protein
MTIDYDGAIIVGVKMEGKGLDWGLDSGERIGNLNLQLFEDQRGMQMTRKIRIGKNLFRKQITLESFYRPLSPAFPLAYILAEKRQVKLLQWSREKIGRALYFSKISLDGGLGLIHVGRKQMQCKDMVLSESIPRN